MATEANELNVSELFDFLKSKLPVLIIVPVIAAALAYAASVFLITPKYTADTKVYILNRSDSDGGAVSSQDFNSSTFLTKDYIEIVTARPVLEEAIRTLGIESTTDGLKARITVTNPSDTRYIVIRVTDTDPEMAMKTADAVRVAASKYITTVMAIRGVNTVEPARLPQYPSSPNVRRNAVAAAMLLLIFLLIVYCLMYVTDNKVKTSDDIERYLGLSVLGVVPRSASVKEKRRETA